MDSIGDYLKQAREEKGFSLKHVASQTRIQEHHLQALETEDFANLPAKVFAKGFVRSYAKILGLNEEEAIQCFLQSSGTFYDQYQSEHPQPHAQVVLEAPPRQGINWTWMLGAIAILGIIAIWYALPQKENIPDLKSEQETSLPTEPLVEPPLQEAVSPETIEPSQLEESAPNLIPPDSTPVLEIDSAPPQPKPIETPTADPPPQPPTRMTDTISTPAESQILEIEATQLTWVVVKSDEQDPNEALLQPGQRITWKADRQFLLTLGNAAGVVIRLNGQLQGPFGKPGQVVRDIRLRP